MSAGPSKKKRSPKVPHDPPKKYIPIVGEIVMRWSRLEYQFGVLVRLLVDTTKQRQQAALLSKRAQDLCALLLLIAPKFASSRDLAEKICELARKVRSAEGWRNKYVHSVYGNWSDEPGVEIRFHLKSDEAGIQGYPISTAELQVFAEKVKDQESRAQQLTTQEKDARRKRPR